MTGTAAGVRHRADDGGVPAATPTLGRVCDYYARPATFTSGGVNGSRREWCEHLAPHAGSVTMVEAATGFRSADISSAGVAHIGWPHLGRTRMTMVPRRVERMLDTTDLLLLHEGWTPSNLVVGAAARRRRIPYLVSAHGVYDPAVVSGLRLGPVRRALEADLLGHALAVHTFFETEISHVRAVAPRARTITAPTGVDPPSGFSWVGDGTYLAWMGRYDIRHKGLDLLVRAVESLPPADRPRIELRGPDHLGDRAQLRRMVDERGMGPWMRVGDELGGDARWDFYAHARAIIHPARWEAYGNSVTEALVMGVPVVLSRTAQLAAPLDAADAALVTALDERSLAGSLVRADRGHLAGMAANGRDWARRNLSWDVAVRRFLAGLAAPTA